MNLSILLVANMMSITTEDCIVALGLLHESATTNTNGFGQSWMTLYLQSAVELQ